MFETVLVGVDFGAASIDAATWVARHLRPERIVLAHVVRPLHPPAYLKGSLIDVDAVVAAARESATTRLDALAAELDAEVTAEVSVGDPPRVLLRLAGEHAADLLVLGEHGARRFAWPTTMGRTAYALLADAPLPVLYARDLPDREPAALLVAQGAGPESADLVAYAGRLQRGWDASALLFHVVDGVFMPHQREDSPAIDPRSLREEIRREAADWLAGVRQKGGVRANDMPIDVAVGDPAAELLAVMHRGPHDMLIVRGSGSPQPGAVPDRVSRVILTASPISVLRIPGKD